MASLQLAINELAKRPLTNKAVTSHLVEHQYLLDKLMAKVEVILEQSKQGAVQPVYFMDLEAAWLELTQL